MRLLDFSDGFETASVPVAGNLTANVIGVYASEAAFVTAKGSAAASGDVFFDSTVGVVKVHNGSAWVVHVGLTATQTVTNKDIDGGTASNSLRITVPKNTKTNLDGLTRKEATVVYGTDTSKLYVDNGSTLVAVGAGGGGGSLVWVEDVDAPTSSVSNSIQSYEFEAGLGQDLYALFKVPASYTAGTQVLLKSTFYSGDSSGTALIQSVATLIRTGTDAVSSTTNQRTSTNSAVTLSGSTTNKPQALSLDLSSSTGTINSVAIAAGDLIKIQLTRGTDTATGIVYVPVFGSEVTS